MQDFKKGTLYLAPTYQFTSDLRTAGTGDSKHKGDVNSASKEVLHKAMLSKVAVRVTAVVADKRSKQAKLNEDLHAALFEICSPLLGAKKLKDNDPSLKNLAPFWALVRCATAQSCHNMELESVLFTDAGINTKDIKFPKMKAAEFRAEFTIARNISAIKTGDILCLPFE
jgi:hypothetical protein